LLEDDECTAPADLWALGCIIYKLFTQVTPFDEKTEYLIFQKIKQGIYPDNDVDIINNNFSSFPLQQKI
jgi:3-phosphoinositide dependent protein kinase-1